MHSLYNRHFQSLLSNCLIVVVLVSSTLTCRLGQLRSICENLSCHEDFPLWVPILPVAIRRNVFCENGSSNSCYRQVPTSCQCLPVRQQKIPINNCTASNRTRLPLEHVNLPLVTPLVTVTAEQWVESSIHLVPARQRKKLRMPELAESNFKGATSSRCCRPTR